MIPRATTAAFLFLCGLMAAGSAVTAQDRITVTAGVDAHAVGMNEVVEYRIEITGASPADVSTPDRPATEGLTLLHAAPTTERSISIVNGVMQDRMAFVWRFRPVQEGTARIGEASVEIAGRTFRTGPVELTVSRQPARNRSGRSPITGQASPPPDDPQGGTDAGVRHRDIFIRAVRDKGSVYQNEQLVVTYYLYVADALHIRNSRAAGAWEADGFWREDLSLEDRQSPAREVIDGRAFNRIPIRRAAFFPTRSGGLRIDSFSIRTEATVVYRGRDSFDSFFGRFRAAYEPVTVTAPPVEVRVRSLPRPAPEGFSGAVGAFDVRSSVDRREVRAGQAVTLELSVEGSGNLAVLPNPSLSLPPGVNDFPPRVETSFERTGTRLTGTRTFRYAVVPRDAGAVEITAPVFTYFNPATGHYHTAGGAVHEVLVHEPGIAGPQEVAAFNHGEPAPMMTAARWQPITRPALGIPAWTALLAFALPLAALAALVAVRRRQRRLAADTIYQRSQSARRTAGKNMAQARHHSASGNLNACFGAVSAAVSGFLDSRYQVSARGLTRPQLDLRLAGHGIPPDLRSRLTDLLSECEIAQYAPAEVSRRDAEAAIARGETLISELSQTSTDRPAYAFR